jgi:hypothetical protein
VKALHPGQHRALESGSIAFLVLFAFVLVGFYLFRPHHNHDMTGYVGSVIAFGEDDPATIHRKTFETLRSQTPEHRFTRLSGRAEDSATAVRILGSDPLSFREALRFYQVRVAYTGLVFFFHRCGFDLVFASHLVSALSVFATLILLGFLFPGQPAFPYHLLIPPFFIACGAHDLARLSTPDALGTLCWTLVFCLVFRRKMASLLLLPLLVLVRNDYILFIILLGIALWFLKMFRWPHLVASLLATFTLQAAVNAHFETFGAIEVLNYLKHMDYMPFPVREGIDLTARDYLSLLSGAVASTLDPCQNTVYFFLSSYGLIACLRLFRPIDSGASAPASIDGIFWISTACLLYIAGHVVVFPFFLDRYFMFIYLITACSLARLLLPSRNRHPSLAADRPGADPDA